MTPEVIFQNKAFLVVDKPPGWLSVAGRKLPNSAPPKAESCLLNHLSKSLKQQVWPVHRLDQPVSGLILFALTRESHRAASAWFEKRLVKKRYDALSDGEEFPPAEETLLWSHYLMRGKKRAYEKPFGKLAETDARFVAPHIHSEQNRGLWSLSPRTGRAHQLRFQMALAGFPIWGDALYGSKTIFPVQDAIALRSVELELPLDESRSFGLPGVLRASRLLDWLNIRAISS